VLELKKQRQRERLELSMVLKKFERNGMFKDDKDGSAKAAYIKDVIKIRD